MAINTLIHFNLLLLTTYLLDKTKAKISPCDTDCTLCITDRDQCLASLAPDGCAWSTNTGCISSLHTPFVLFYGTVKWVVAQSICLSHGLKLASIRNEQENEWAASICNSQGVGGDCWIGLRYDDGPDYEWSDGTTFTYGSYKFNGAANYPRPPWDTKPNDGPYNAPPRLCGQGLPDTITNAPCCVYLDKESAAGGWEDRNCNNRNLESTLCRKQTLSPTSNPTTQPSITPTSNPTTQPSITPTKSPTDQPTLAPTNSTNNPTLKPTQDSEGSEDDYDDILVKAMDKSENIAIDHDNNQEIKMIFNIRSNVVVYLFGFIVLLMVTGYLLYTYKFYNKQNTTKDIQIV